MDVDETWDGQLVETSSFDSQFEEEKPLKKLWNRLFGLFICVCVGIYAGLMCRTMQESWIYAALFCGESLVCACVAGIIKTYSFKKSITAFAIYYLISAIVTPITTWLSFAFSY
ncbi:hypothetical protein TVAG_379380 [Trichomonas vaginalis G3]|uniref:Uncharacterized protein n=1 Tax=Trichomonas vaginalis (strain ATCC PRA-98 / G3) TaxID=412133 RepID=A2E7G3_TRIV3|nr:hypothetical protein TVAGG3_0339440 [Trichomonas vaginalis G3]EAY11356.1 hypothetical protein TVAG_379380 [Trichomonas vaginalis G3]KAI5530521.1 hypothetical protein TVAGG3_0339440 [Trichomonas vaginalis G3]|eukprot:XP_001323579.1 hypothetical protein [Trichomonas vaginalis G3]